MGKTRRVCFFIRRERLKIDREGVFMPINRVFTPRNRVKLPREPLKAAREVVITRRECVMMRRVCVNMRREWILTRLFAAFTNRLAQGAMLDHQTQTLHDFNSLFGERFSDFIVVNPRLHPNGFRLFR